MKGIIKTAPMEVTSMGKINLPTTPNFLKEAQGSKISTGGITTFRIPQKEKGDGSQSRHYQSDGDYG